MDLVDKFLHWKILQASLSILSQLWVKYNTLEQRKDYETSYIPFEFYLQI